MELWTRSEVEQHRVRRDENRSAVTKTCERCSLRRSQEFRTNCQKAK
jgi:hypothetical protein